MALTWTLRDTGAHIASPSYCYDFKRFSNRLYASCYYGIPYTIDAGVNWIMTNERASGTNYYCNRLIVHNGRLFASGQRTVPGSNSSICYYTDNGVNWTTKVVSNSFSFPSGLGLYSIDSRLFMGNSGNIAYGANGAYYYTDDDGVTWIQVQNPLRSCYVMMEYSGKFYICGQFNNANKRCAVYYATNPISPSWVNASTGLSIVNGKAVVSFANFDGSLYCCDSDGSVYKLVTATSWTEVFSGLDYCRHLEVFYEKLYVCGDSATIGESSVYSTADGITWIAEGITSYSTDVYGIWGDTSLSNFWAGTNSSRAWITSGLPFSIDITAKVVGVKILLSWVKTGFLAGSVFTYNIYWIAEDDLSEVTASAIKSEGTKISGIYNTYYLFEPDEFDVTYYFTVTIENEFSYESYPENYVSELVLSDNPDDVGDKVMQEFYYELTYRLNIAADVNQRTEQVRFWSNEELLRAINEGYLDFVRRTMCLQKFTAIGLEADKTEYDLPSDCIKLLWVSDGTRNLIGQSLAYMDDLDPGWLTRDGTPAYYVQELAGIKKFNLYETPETSGISTFTADTNHTEAAADHGLIVGLEQDDEEVTFTADTNHTEADVDHGIVINVTGEPVLFSEEIETGIFVKLEQQTDNLMILYAYEPVLFNNLQEAQTPVFLAAYHLALVNFAVSELYLKEGETQNIPLSEFYRMLYEDAVQNKLETQHVSNLKIVNAGASTRDRLPAGPHLPYDTYPAH